MKPPTNPTLRIVFPEGFTREQMAAGSQPSTRLRAGNATSTRACPRAATSRRRSAFARRRSSRRTFPTRGRGLPLPGAVRIHRADDVQEARRGPAHRVPPELEEGQSGVREGTQPHTVRRPHHRLDHRTRGSRAERSEAGRRRHLQPFARRDVAWPRRNRPLRPSYPAGKAPDGRAGERFQPVTTRARTTVCRRRRSRTPGSLRCRQPRIRRRQLPLLLSQAQQGSPLLHASLDAFNAYKAAHPPQ